MVSGTFAAIVHNLSEGGCLVEVSGPAAGVFRPVGARISGVIIFSDDSRVDFTGEIARIINSAQVVLKFLSGPTFAKMMGEHRRIREMYG